MKKHVLILLIGLISFSSCDEMIDIEPENSVTYYNFFKTEKDMESVAYNMHALLRDNFFCKNTRTGLTGCVTDKLDSYERGHRIRNADSFGKYDLTYSWEANYQIVTWANMILDNIDLVEDLTKDRRNYYLGQAYFVRAFSYFKMIQRWGDVPLVTSSTESDALARTPWREVAQFAIEDAEKAAEYLDPWIELTDASGNPVTTKQIPGKGTAYALLAHMHAWLGSFGGVEGHTEKAVTYATYVIEGNPAENYAPEFALVSDPETVVTDVAYGGTSESIFDANVNYEDLSDNTSTFCLEFYFQRWPITPGSLKGNLSSSLGFRIKNTTVDEMYTNGDLRKYAYFYQFDELKDDPILDGWAVVNKRREVVTDNSSGLVEYANYKGEYPVFKLSDIILLRAECNARLGNDGAAIIDLNTVRERAQADLYNPSEGSLNLTVFKEREKELLLEGHRWFDLLRTGLWRSQLVEDMPQFTEQDIEDGAFFFPVYQDAFVKNNLMTQTPYWAVNW